MSALKQAWLRDSAVRVVYGQWAALGMVPVVAATTLFTGAPVQVALLPACVLAAISLLARGLAPRYLAVVLGIVLAGQGIAHTASFAGHEFQIDSHMMFFALLAVAATMRSIFALLAMAGVVAIHHLSFGFLVPALIYPSADAFVNLERTLLHAAVVVLQVSFLSLSIWSQNRQGLEMEQVNHAATVAARAAETARQEAEARQAQADSARTAIAAVVADLGKHLKAVGGRDLTGRLGADVPVEFQDLAHDYDMALALMSDALSETCSIATEFHQQADASAEASRQMAHQLEVQATGVTEASDSIRALSSSLGDTERAMGDLSTQTEAAANSAQRGGDIVRQAVGAMGQVRQSSDEIGSIIQVIDDISFQTNLLALNAGVEAARAGSAGAGFAVVASEVRALSHRTSEAARQVKDLISASEGHVSDGVQMVDAAGAALEEIEATIGSAVGAVGDLSSQITQQTAQLQDMSQAVEAIDKAMQGYTAQTQEVSAMATQMSATASDLHDGMARYTLGASTATVADNEARGAA